MDAPANLFEETQMTVTMIRDGDVVDLTKEHMFYQTCLSHNTHDEKVPSDLKASACTHIRHVSSSAATPRTRGTLTRGYMQADMRSLWSHRFHILHSHHVL
jgi:hypothetical protein